MDRQQEFVLRTIEERDVRFVRLWFTDVVGSLKSVALAPAEVEGAFDEGLGFDGSAIEGLARVFESDMLAQPDPSTFQILPWRGETEQTSRMFCDILTPDGEPSAADPRNVLKRTLAKAADMGSLKHMPRWPLLATTVYAGPSRCALFATRLWTLSIQSLTIQADVQTSGAAIVHR